MKDFSTVIQRIEENQSDMSTLIRQWRNLTSPTAQNVTFRFFDGTETTFPNIASLVAQYGSGDVASNPDTVVRRDSQGGVNVSTINMTRQSTSGSMTISWSTDWHWIQNFTEGTLSTIQNYEGYYSRKLTGGGASGQVSRLNPTNLIIGSTNDYGRTYLTTKRNLNIDAAGMWLTTPAVDSPGGYRDISASLGSAPDEIYKLNFSNVKVQGGSDFTYSSLTSAEQVVLTRTSTNDTILMAMDLPTGKLTVQRSQSGSRGSVEVDATTSVVKMEIGGGSSVITTQIGGLGIKSKTSAMNDTTFNNLPSIKPVVIRIPFPSNPANSWSYDLSNYLPSDCVVVSSSLSLKMKNGDVTGASEGYITGNSPAVNNTSSVATAYADPMAWAVLVRNARTNHASATNYIAEFTKNFINAHYNDPSVALVTVWITDSEPV